MSTRVITITPSERPTSTEEEDERPSSTSTRTSSRTTERSRSSSSPTSTGSTTSSRTTRTTESATTTSDESTTSETSSSTTESTSESTTETPSPTDTTLTTSVLTASSSISTSIASISATASSTAAPAKKVPVAIIAGSAGGGVALLVIIGLLIYYIRHAAQSRKTKQIELTQSLVAKTAASTQTSPQSSPQTREIPPRDYTRIPSAPVVPRALTTYSVQQPYTRQSSAPNVGDRFTGYWNTNNDGTAYDEWVNPPVAPRQSSQSSRMSTNTYRDSQRYYAYQPQTSQAPVHELESPDTPAPPNHPWTPPNIGRAK